VFLRRQLQDLAPPPGRGSSAAHVTFTIARQVPRHVVSQILFRIWYFKLEVWVMGWHTQRLCGGGIVLDIGKLMQEGVLYCGVGSLPYCPPPIYTSRVQVSPVSQLCKVY